MVYAFLPKSSMVCSAITRWRYSDDHRFAIATMKEKVLIVDMYGMAIGNGQPT